MNRWLPLALVQTPTLQLPDNLSAFAQDLRRRSFFWRPGTLVVYPELHLCPTPSDTSLHEVAEPLEGERCRRLAQLAAELNIWLVPGSVYESDSTGAVYNTAPVFSPQGRRIAAYRKIFPWRPYETTTPGGAFTVFDMPDVGRVGLSICYDNWFPEHARHLAWLGAELIVNCVQTPTNDREQECIMVRANAICNQVFVASVNAAAPSGIGQSLIVDPEGRVRTDTAAAETTMLCDVIDLNEVTKVQQLGTLGLNRLWSQFQPSDAPLDLPLYEGRIAPANWAGKTAAANPEPEEHHHGNT